AYEEVSSKQETDVERKWSGILEEGQRSAEIPIDQVPRRLQEQAREYGHTHLDAFYDAAAQRLNTLESAMEEVRIAMAGAPQAPANAAAQAAARQPAEPATQPATQPAAPRSAEELAAEDPVL